MSRASRGGRWSAVRTVLFDLDGTLVDSLELILESFRHTMEVHLGEAPPDEAWLATMGTPLVAQLRDFAESEAQAEAMLATYVEHNAEVHETLIRPFEGVRETLVELRRREIRIGIVTSKMAAGTRRALASCDLPEEWFDVLVTADDPVPHKPDPAPVRLALERTGAAARASAYVGDSVWDLRAGRAAGTRTAAALWGPFSALELAAERPDVELDRIEEILRLLED